MSFLRFENQTHDTSICSVNSSSQGFCLPILLSTRPCCLVIATLSGSRHTDFMKLLAMLHARSVSRLSELYSAERVRTSNRLCALHLAERAKASWLYLEECCQIRGRACRLTQSTKLRFGSSDLYQSKEPRSHS